MNTVSLPLIRGCQCGGLQYRLSEPPLTIDACHCTHRRKQTGRAQAWFRPDVEDAVWRAQPTDYASLVERFAALQTFSG